MTTPTTKQQFHLNEPIDTPFPPEFNKRMDLIASLGRQRDAILNSPVFDLAKAQALVLAYEVAKMPSCAADLRKRVEYYEQRLEAENEQR
jgi:hypothetical protein